MRGDSDGSQISPLAVPRRSDTSHVPSKRLTQQVAPHRTVTDVASVFELMEALRDAEARADRYAQAMRWWTARFVGQVARATQAEARATRFEDALDHTCLRAVYAERELEAAEAAICRECTPIFNGTERLTIAERIRWLGDKQTHASELGAVDVPPLTARAGAPRNLLQMCPNAFLTLGRERVGGAAPDSNVL